MTRLLPVSYIALLLGLAAGTVACKPEKPESPIADFIRGGMFAVNNFSGKTVIAPTVRDTTGNHGVFDQNIDDQDGTVMGKIFSFRDGDSITVEWIAGEGRAHWLSATLPVKTEQAGGKFVEIDIRPDQFVCARLIDDAHFSNRTDSGELARVRQDRAQLSCVKPVELPRLVPGMASGFEQDTRSHSWELYDRAGTSTLTNQTLTHKTGAVSFRYGRDYKDRPYFINEFNSVRLMGNSAAWLVNANLAPARPGLFIVTGDNAGWKSRYLGDTEGEETRLSDNRILIGKHVVVDSATADVFILPRFRGVDYWVLGQSPDGRYLSIYWQQDARLLPKGAKATFNVAMLDLETGQEGESDVPRVPALPAGGFIVDFYPAWYRDHCTWGPLLKCK